MKKTKEWTREDILNVLVSAQPEPVSELRDDEITAEMYAKMFSPPITPDAAREKLKKLQDTKTPIEINGKIGYVKSRRIQIGSKRPFAFSIVTEDNDG